MPQPPKAVATIGAKGGALGRPRKEPPTGKGFEELCVEVQQLAADGWSIVGIAFKAGGVSKDIFARWLKDYPELQEAFEVGRENERRTLHNEVYRTATEPSDNPAVKLRAAMFLLNSRHGYREADQEQGPRTNVIINLPGSLSREDYLREVVSEQ